MPRNVTENRKKPDLSSFPLSDYAKKLKPRYLEKISVTGIDPVLIEGKHFQADCLPPVKSTDLLFYIQLFWRQAFLHSSSLRFSEALKLIIRWCLDSFSALIQGHIIADKFVVLAKVRHSQHMKDSLIPICIITETEGTTLSTHCRGCKAGLAESCSHIASVLFYLEAWTKIALSLIPEYADSYVVKSRTIPTLSDHFNQKYLDLTYPELLRFCFQTKYH